MFWLVRGGFGDLVSGFVEVCWGWIGHNFRCLSGVGGGSKAEALNSAATAKKYR